MRDGFLQPAAAGTDAGELLELVWRSSPSPPSVAPQRGRRRWPDSPSRSTPRGIARRSSRFVRAVGLAVPVAVTRFVQAVCDRASEARPAPMEFANHIQSFACGSSCRSNRPQPLDRDPSWPFGSRRP